METKNELKTTVKIPVIKEDVIITTKEVGLISSFIGITNVDMRDSAIEKIKKEASKYKKFKYYYDCKHHIQLEDMRWGMLTENINVFEHFNVNKKTAVIHDNNHSYECVYWFTAYDKKLVKTELCC